MRPGNTYIIRVPGKLVTASKPDQETDMAVHKSCEPTYTRVWQPSQRGLCASSFELLPPARIPGEGASNPDFKLLKMRHAGLPRWLSGKESGCNAGDASLIPRLGRSPGEGNGYSFQFLAWEIPWTGEPGGLQSMGLQRVRHD